MSRVPAVTPDGAKIGQLIWDRGYSRAGFARQLRLTRGAKSIYNIISTNQRSSVELVREIARVLGVSYEEIILRDDIEPEALASLDAKTGPAAGTAGPGRELPQA